MLSNLISIFFLFIAVMFTSINIMRAFNKQTLPGMNFIVMAVGWTGFVAFMWIL